MSEIKFYDCYGFEDTHEISKCGKLFRKEFQTRYSKDIDKLVTRKRRQLFGQDRNGYVYQQMPGNNSGRKKNNIFVHRLVAQTFIPNPENKSQVNHKNGIKNDNRVENLEWCTSVENLNHALDNNLRIMPNGEKHHKSKLTEVQVLEIRNSDLSQKELTILYNVKQSLISAIINRKKWKHI